MSGIPDIKIEVKIGGNIVKRNLSEDLRVDEENINEYLVRAPGLVAYWNALYNKQRAIVQRTKVALDRKHAELDRQVRARAAETGTKITNAEVEAAITLDPEYMQLQDKYLDELEKEGLLKSCVNALQELRSTLISLSANLRATGTIKLKAKVNELDEALREKLSYGGKR